MGQEEGEKWICRCASMLCVLLNSTGGIHACCGSCLGNGFVSDLFDRDTESFTGGRDPTGRLTVE